MLLPCVVVPRDEEGLHHPRQRREEGGVPGNLNNKHFFSLKQEQTLFKDRRNPKRSRVL